MRNSFLGLNEVALVLIGSLIVAAGSLVVVPIVMEKPILLLALPVALLIFVFMVLNIRVMFLVVILTRAMLDPILAMTQVDASGGGIGGLLNLFVIAMVFIQILKQPQVLQKNPFVLPWLSFFGACFLSAVFADNRMAAIKLMLNLMTYAAVFFIPFFMVRSQVDKRYWVKVIFISTLAPVALALLGCVYHHPMLHVYGRLKGTFAHSNILAMYLVFVITFCFYILRSRPIALSLLQRSWMWIYILIAVGVLIITETRSAWIAFALFFAMYGFFKERKILFLGAIALTILLGLPAVQERLADLKEGTGVRTNEKLNSMSWRFKMWEAATPLMLKKPLTGYGLGSFQAMSRDFFDKANQDSGSPAHNVYVELLFETGIMGLITFLVLLFSILKTFFMRMTKSKGPPSMESAVFFSYLIAFMFISFSDNTLYYLSANWYMWFAFGLMFAGWQMPEKAVRAAA
jgi:O-antigen ligase